MHKSNVFLHRFIEHGRSVTCGLLVWLLAGYFGAMAFAATPVILMPVPKPQFFDNAGRPLAFGCVFSYAIGTTTPLATYTDYTGTTLNSNPVDLTLGGFTANGSNGIWLQAGLAYRLVVKAAGGTHCSTGATQYTIDGIGGGVTTLTTNVTYSTTPVFNIQAQNQLFVITLTGNASSQPLTAVGIIPPGLVTWEIIQDNVGGHTFSWPANSVGGCTIGSTANQVTIQHFIWDGTNAYAVGPCTVGNGPEIDTGTINVAGNVNVTGFVAAQYYKSLCANPATAGAIRLCKTDAINWLNDAGLANQGISQDTSNRGIWSFAGGLETTGTIPDIFLGGTTASFPRLKRNSTAINFRLGDDSADAPITASTLALSGPLTSSSSSYEDECAEVSTPSSPAASKQRGFCKAGAGKCSVDSAGNLYCMSGGTASTLVKVFNFTTCNTGSGSVPTTCTGTANLPATQPDTNYSVMCTFDSGDAATPGTCTNLNTGTNPCPASITVYNLATTTFHYSLTNVQGVSTGSGIFGTAHCAVGHN